MSGITKNSLPDVDAIIASLFSPTADSLQKHYHVAWEKFDKVKRHYR